jgi:hypothetical protein
VTNMLLLQTAKISQSPNRDVTIAMATYKPTDIKPKFTFVKSPL